MPRFKPDKQIAVGGNRRDGLQVLAELDAVFNQRCDGHSARLR